MKIITVGTVINRFKITGSLARALIRQLKSEKAISLVGTHHSKMWCYTGSNVKSVE